MDYDVQTVPLSHVVEADETFRISTREPNDALKASIQSVGLIHPPIVGHKDNYRVVVSGFARVAVCRSLGWHQIPLRILPPETPFAHCALIAVSENAAIRDLNVVEMARALDLLSRAVERKSDIAGLMQSIGLAANPQLLEKLQHINQMNDRLRQGLCDGTLSLPMALRLHGLEDAAATEQLCILFQELGWGLNRQREFLDQVQAIAQRDTIALMAILTDQQLLQWRADTRMDRAHKSQLIRQHIKKWRYPAITAFEQQYAQAVKALQIPQGAQLIPPPYFEGRTYSLKLDFKNQEELERLAGDVNRLVSSPILKKMLSGE